MPDLPPGLSREISLAALAKPAEGSPCTRCGLCCLMQQCQISESIFGLHERCPALERVGDAWACGLITDPARHLGCPPAIAPHFAHLFGGMLWIGHGCDSIADWELPPE